ncbi:hypothetical protein TIFTF001_025346 [Ficus carica]|uniref:DUF7054 domain-containing protein n=1 Tax=Ficus carica TaxID=3494 RepID=A0AA88DE31_FICCA|nr:hypothetical protein TIFTF001_025346 [Ficus carica]
MISHRRRQEEKNRRSGRLAEKSLSFHCRSSSSEMISQLRRSKTAPDLLSGRSVVVTTSLEQVRPMKLTKVLLNVTIQGRVGAVQVLMAPESTVGDVVTAALLGTLRKVAVRSCRPPSPRDSTSITPSSAWNVSLNRKEHVMELGSRNFFLCPNTTMNDCGTTSSSSCAALADKGVVESGVNWLNFMDFML